LKSKIFFSRPNKISQEPTEAGKYQRMKKMFFSILFFYFLVEIALGKSQKSILELKLALGRLMNFIELSSKIDFFCN